MKVLYCSYVLVFVQSLDGGLMFNVIVSKVGLGQQQSKSALTNQSKESLELNHAPEANISIGKAVATV